MKLKSVLTAAGLLTFCWLLFLVFRMVFEQRPGENVHYLPEDTRFALRLDGRNFLEESLLSVLVEAKDEQVVEQVRRLLARPRKKGGGKSRNLGIDYFSDVIYFTAGTGPHTYSGLLLNLNNPRRFRKKIHDYDADIAYAGTRGHVGIILFRGTENVASLKQRGKAIEANDKDLFFSEPETGSPREKKLLSIYTQPGSFRFPNEGIGIMHVRSAGHQLSFDGTISTGIQNHSAKRLTPTDLHIYSVLIPEFVQDSLQNLARGNGVKLPRLRSFSMNYRGLKLFLHKDKMLFLPDVELLLEFEEAVDAETTIEQSGLLSYFGITSGNGMYRIGDERRYVSQPDSGSVYIGSVEAPRLEPAGTLEFAILGNPEMLTNVEADMMISMVMNAYPPYQASKSFLEHAREINIQIRSRKNGPSVLSGDISFDEGRYPFNELIKLLLDGQFIGSASSATL